MGPASLLALPLLLLAVPGRTSAPAQAQCGSGDEASALLQTRGAAPARLGAGGAAAGGEEGDSSPVLFFKNDEVEKVLPMAPRSYPEQLQGVLWLDQTGAYGSTDLAWGFPDFCMTFGDKARKLDTETRRIVVAPWGKAWSWQNNWLGYGWWSYAHLTNYEYEFVFNENYTEAQLLTTFHLGWFGKLTIPAWYADLRMVLQTPAPGKCPPAPGAPKAEINKCALWRRETRGVSMPSLQPYPVQYYYIFRVADRDGKPLQPYYNALLGHANQVLPPDTANASLYLGIDLLKAGGLQQGLSIVGTSSKHVLPGFNTDGRPFGPCRNLFTPWGFTRCMMQFVGLLRDSGLFK